MDPAAKYVFIATLLLTSCERQTPPAQTPPTISAEALTRLIKHADYAAIERLIDQQETFWKASPSVAYFQNMLTIGEMLTGGKTDQSVWLGRKVFWKLLLKPTPNLYGAPQTIRIIKQSMLLVDAESINPYVNNASPAMFASIRHDTFLMLSAYAREAQATIIPGYRNKSAWSQDPDKQNAIDNEVQAQARYAIAWLAEDQDYYLIEAYSREPRDDEELKDLLDILNVQGTHRDHVVRHSTQGELFSSESRSFLGAPPHNSAAALKVQVGKLVDNGKLPEVVKLIDTQEILRETTPGMPYFTNMQAICIGIAIGAPSIRSYWLFHETAWRVLLTPTPTGKDFTAVSRCKELIVRDAEGMTRYSMGMGMDQYVLMRHDTAALLMEYTRQIQAQFIPPHQPKSLAAADDPAAKNHPLQAATDYENRRELAAERARLTDFNIPFLIEAYHNGPKDNQELALLLDTLDIKGTNRDRIIGSSVIVKP